MKTAWIGIVLVVMALGTPTALALPSTPALPQASTVTATYTLYGNSTSGWGFSPSAITEPGPTITASAGEVVTLRLFSDDGASHNWFLALDSGSGPTPGEPSSLDFISSTAPVVYTFTVPNRLGSFTYKCRIHPTLMTGTFVIVAAPTYVLYGDSVQGWGTSAATISTPGPTLAATQGQALEIALYSRDNATHQFFVSYDGAQTPSQGEPVSANFSSSLVPVFVVFTPSQAGNFTYYCRYHPSTMKGILDVGALGGAGSPPSYTVYATVIVVIAIVAIAAAVFIQSKPRSPPAQPPASPPGPG